MTAADYPRVPRVVGADYESPVARSLEEIWETEPGVYGWISTVDHKEIGIRYLVTAFAFLLVGGIEALIMRLQLARPNQALLTPQTYDDFFTLHAITMIFLYALPVLSGFSNYLFPLALGARDMAFPRMNAFSYWIYLASGLFIYASLIFWEPPNAGWFNYVPFAQREYSPGVGIDFYALGMVFNGISTTIGAANFLVTFMRMRAPGMSLNRVPILAWGTSTISVGNLLSVPAVSLAFFLLWADRQFGTHFYRADGGGHPLLWQHLFWMFAHPWVYVVVLPAMGLVSDSLPFFCRRPLVGYTVVVLATITTMALGFGVWVHHMFATGIPFLASMFFSDASFVITIPSAVSVFAWIATIWSGRPVATCAFHYYAAFIVMFVIGGVSGVMTASVPADLQLHDTYFVVAHFHYTLIGINLLAVLGALHTWFPKMSGRMMDETIGRWAFWLILIGFNVTFFTMHWTGLAGMPRRNYTYPPGLGWSALNLIESIGAYVLALGLLLIVVNLAVSLFRGEEAGRNPVGGDTLEWSTTSPPPPYNYAVIPTVSSPYPMWDEDDRKLDNRRLDRGEGLLERGHETPATTAQDAILDEILKMPSHSIWPPVSALTLAGV
ncbi:MAG: cbb3-type cytochrome c oxidase subunit I, partial [Methylobacteriaceae bacterium]|nr:cbb3-type cytochrome c oxidase subunit I [Methylobacteriaceae bacterium]